MTDRYCAFTVILEKEIREDDCSAILDAIRMVKGVREVVPILANPEYYSALVRIKQELWMKIITLVKEF